MLCRFRRVRGRAGFWAPWAAAAALLAAFAVLAWKTAVETGPTFDEPAHLADGYVALKTGNHSLNPEHPPLCKLWAALPLLRMRDIPPLDDLSKLDGLTSWAAGVNLFFSRGAETAERVMASARRQMLLFAVALGVVVFLWSRELWGIWGGVFSLGLYCFSPSLIGHAGLVHTDIAATLGFALIGWLAWRRGWERSWGATALLGLALGFALCVKFSGVLAIPPLALWLAFAPGRLKRFGEAGQRERAEGAGSARILAEEELARRVGRIVLILAIAAAACVAVYGWPPDWFGYLSGLDRVYKNHIPGFGFYFWGRRWPHRLLLYFPGAMVVKTPVPALAAMIAAMACLRRRNWRRAAFPLVGAAYLMATAMALAANIGVRYVFPACGFLLVFAGVLLSEGLRWPGARAALAAGLTACMAWTAVRNVPDGIAYFNAIAGGAQGGIRYLDDSNLDWGQGIPQTVEYIRRHPQEKIVVGWRANVTPAHYGAAYTLLDENLDQIFMPREATYLLSANLLTLGKLSNVEGLRFDWLDRYRPAQILAGGAIYVYKFGYAGPEGPRFDGSSGTNWIDEEATLRSGIDRLRRTAREARSLDLLKLSALGALRLGVWLMQQRRYSEAIEAFQSARRDGYRKEAAAAGLALAYCQLGRVEEARGELENLRQLAPGHPDLPVIESQIESLEKKR